METRVKATYRMSGMMLGFADGTNSTMLQSDNATLEQIQTIQIDQSRRIHAVSVHIYKGRNLEGLRMYDADMGLLVDFMWKSNAEGIWTEPQVIPAG